MGGALETEEEAAAGCSEVETGEKQRPLLTPGLERSAARTGRVGWGSSVGKRGAGDRVVTTEPPPCTGLSGPRLPGPSGGSSPGRDGIGCRGRDGEMALGEMGDLHRVTQLENQILAPKRVLFAGRLVAQSCLTLCDPMDCKPPVSSLFMKFSRQEYWSRLPRPPPGDLPDPGNEPTSPALAGGFFTTEPPEKPSLHWLPHCVKASFASRLGAEDHWGFLKNPHCRAGPRLVFAAVWGTGQAERPPISRWTDIRRPSQALQVLCTHSIFLSQFITYSWLPFSWPYIQQLLLAFATPLDAGKALNTL